MRAAASCRGSSHIFHMSRILLRKFKLNKGQLFIKKEKRKLAPELANIDSGVKKSELLDGLNSVHREREKLESPLKNTSLEKESSETWRKLGKVEG